MGKHESLVHSGYQCHDVTVTAGGTAILIMHQGSSHHSGRHTIQGGGSTRGSKTPTLRAASQGGNGTHPKNTVAGRDTVLLFHSFLSKKNHHSVFYINSSTLISNLELSVHHRSNLSNSSINAYRNKTLLFDHDSIVFRKSHRRFLVPGCVYTNWIYGCQCASLDEWARIFVQVACGEQPFADGVSGEWSLRETHEVWRHRDLCGIFPESTCIPCRPRPFVLSWHGRIVSLKRFTVFKAITAIH